MKIIYKISVLIIVVFCVSGFSQQWRKIVNLEGTWRFAIGDNSAYSQLNFNDQDWDDVYVPSAFEDQGFHGYNGYAWYRKSFKISSDYKGRAFYIKLGNIDDVDEVYLNGHLIGATGSFPPDYRTAHNIDRIYPLPENLLKFNERNVISVRLYDQQLSGGILRGDLGIFLVLNSTIDIPLEGIWKIDFSDDPNHKNKNVNTEKWSNIFVPSRWEGQGFIYDGYAWYRKTFTVPDNLKGNLVLMAGKIDDLEEIYINGKFIGRVGDLNKRRVEGWEWQQFRTYFIPKDLLIPNQENSIAIRVYDSYKDGGIYKGPVGILTQENYRKYWKPDNKKQNKDKNILDWLFNN